jgi:hypothetical protein
VRGSRPSQPPVISGKGDSIPNLKIRNSIWFQGRHKGREEVLKRAVVDPRRLLSKGDDAEGRGGEIGSRFQE